MNLRCDNYFVEDEAWHEAADRYADFLEQHQSEKVVLIELGVGFNTPIIIRFPFEKMVRENASYILIRLNKLLSRKALENVQLGSTEIWPMQSQIYGGYHDTE